jgi:hypothetical protein
MNIFKRIFYFFTYWPQIWINLSQLKVETIHDSKDDSAVVQESSDNSDIIINLSDRINTQKESSNEELEEVEESVVDKLKEDESTILNNIPDSIINYENIADRVVKEILKDDNWKI